jgi:hypothetical protein
MPSWRLLPFSPKKSIGTMKELRERSTTMPKPDEEWLAKAREYWDGGQPLEAGRFIHDSLPPAERPAWAVKTLRLVLDKSGARRNSFIRILETAENPRWWANGHRCFDLLRTSGLNIAELGRKRGLTKDQEVYARLLGLAELVAKVTYNAVDPPDPFDADAGWWIAESLRWFVDFWKDDEFSTAVWLALCRQVP